MDKVDVFRTIMDCQSKLEDAYDLWSEIPVSIISELEHLFIHDEGVRYHINRAMGRLKEINSQDIDAAFEACDGDSL